MNDLVLTDLKTEISVGKITTNAVELLAFVKEGVEKYLNDHYIPNESEAKHDRAELNRVETAIASQALQIKKAYNAPLEEFNNIVSEIRTTIKEAVQTVDKAVKTYEELQKSKKRREVTDYFITKKFELVPLERIWDERWLNKGMKLKEVAEQIDAAIAKIYGDIQILERIPDHGMTAKALYLETLDMSAALRKVDALKENAERLAKEEANRETRQAQEQCDRNAAAERQEVRDKAKEEIISTKVDEAMGLRRGTTAKEEREEVLEYTMTLKGTQVQLLKLREFMTANGIPYQKGLLLENDAHARHQLKQRNLDGRIYSFIYIPAV